jgi:hypothetical protein
MALRYPTISISLSNGHAYFTATDPALLALLSADIKTGNYP